MQRVILITAAAPGKPADSKLTVASDYLHSLRVFEWNWKRTTEIFFLLFQERSETKSMSNHKWVCNPLHSLFCWEPPRARAREQGSTTEPQARTSRARAFFRNKTLHWIKDEISTFWFIKSRERESCFIIVLAHVIWTTVTPSITN